MRAALYLLLGGVLGTILIIVVSVLYVASDQDKQEEEYWRERPDQCDGNYKANKEWERKLP